MTRIRQPIRSKIARRHGDVRGSSTASLPLIIAVAIVAILLNPDPAVACISEMPTFDYVVNNASAIARVTVLEGRDRDLSETFRIDRVLKGRLPATVVLEPARSSLCGDTVSFYVGAGEENVGESAILALDVQFFDQVIHPVWGGVEGRLGGSAGLPDGVSALPELERAIAAAITALPATDVDDPVDREDSGWHASLAMMAIVTLGLLSAIFSFRRARSADG